MIGQKTNHDSTHHTAKGLFTEPFPKFQKLFLVTRGATVSFQAIYCGVFFIDLESASAILGPESGVVGKRPD